MASSTAFLHIGAPKTGTTYVQDMLWANKDVLDQAGVLVPGHYRYARVPAVREILKWDPSESQQLPDRWLRLAREMKRWGGHSSVLSQEFLCRLTDQQTHAVIESLGSVSVHAVLTVRDISRLVTAQWQTAMRSRKPWTYTDYSAAVAGASEHAQRSVMSDHFWVRHNYEAILQRWISEVGLANVTVVTVPQSGSDPEELWRRFCQACAIDESTTAAAETAHESLGAASAELMRRLNRHDTVRSMELKTYQRSVNTAISRRGLVNRREKEPKLALPLEHAEWASQTAAEMITMISDLGVRVVGDLDDLRPRPASSAPTVPEALDSGELLSACIDGLAGLAVEHAKLSHTDEPEQRVAGGRSGHADPEGRGTIKRARAAWRRRASLRQRLRRRLALRQRLRLR
jgi:hypothetical protein